MRKLGSILSSMRNCVCCGFPTRSAHFWCFFMTIWMRWTSWGMILNTIVLFCTAGLWCFVVWWPVFFSFFSLLSFFYFIFARLHICSLRWRIHLRRYLPLSGICRYDTKTEWRSRPLALFYIFLCLAAYIIIDLVDPKRNQHLGRCVSSLKSNRPFF